MNKKEREKIEDRIYSVYYEVPDQLQTEMVDNIINLMSLQDSLQRAGKNTAAFVIRDAIVQILEQEDRVIPKKEFLR